MECSEVKTRPEAVAGQSEDTPPFKSLDGNIRLAQSEMGSCPSCSAAAPDDGTRTPTYIYAIGSIETRFPRLSVEKEFAQATSRTDTKGLTDHQVLHAVLSASENRYLVRQLCWVLAIEGLDTYILRPRDPADFALLVEAVRPTPRPMDLDVTIGVKGPIAQPEVCNGLMVPILLFDQIYSFDRESLIKSIPHSEKIAATDFQPAAEELFDRIMQMADNSGATDEHRALNYCALRYPAIYAITAERFGLNSSLTAVNVQPSALSVTRKVAEVIFSFTNRNTDVVEKYFCRVDVTEEFPFLVTKMSPYCDH